MKLKPGMRVQYTTTYLLDDNPAWPITFRLKGTVIERHKGSVLVALKLNAPNAKPFEKWVHKSSLRVIEG